MALPPVIILPISYFVFKEKIGWPAILSWERTLGERFLNGLPESCRLHGLPTMDGRVPTFAFKDTKEAAVLFRHGELTGVAGWLGNCRQDRPPSNVRLFVSEDAAAADLSSIPASSQRSACFARLTRGPGTDAGRRPACLPAPLVRRSWRL